MPKQKIRFAVGSPDSPRSAVWSMFWRDHDAYVVSVEAGGVAKFSFHLRISEFSWGYTRDYFEQNQQSLIGQKSRDFERWRRPAEFAAGLTLPLRIYVANEALKIDRELPTQKPIRWVRPQPGKAVGFLFVLASHQIRENPYGSRPNLELLARAWFPACCEAMLLYAHHLEAEKVASIANGAIIEFTNRYPHVALSEHHRVYTQVEPPEPKTGSRNFIEIPTYALPFLASPAG